MMHGEQTPMPILVVRPPNYRGGYIVDIFGFEVVTIGVSQKAKVVDQMPKPRRSIVTVVRFKRQSSRQADQHFEKRTS
jgi:hypothetical protein